ncbi:MAG: membrane-bound PQQ-dependent dehydrogenase, glucose/quinate/shikimate family [Neoaquamicrobium sediminum]|uniref:membrane-bound PQQ-dependent dehydrogenase, glucose/quinate/shikimate family n=1 Tax=Neoaquamicrobium sediminum TaxID=1849104 RepID=UPI0040367B89
MKTVLAIVLLLLGFLIGGGGIWLIALGGSWYYLLAGAAFAFTGFALWLRNPIALYVYAALVLGSLFWALYEVGMDWWALAPRGGLIVVLGIILLGLLIGRRPPNLAGAWRWGGATLGATLVTTIAVAVFAMLSEPDTLKGQVAEAGEISLPPSEASVPPEQWVAYGRTSGGSHYSPLAAITPANVGQLEEAWVYRTGDVRDPEVDPEETTYEVTPTMVDGFLYLCTPHHIAIALDPVSGEERWRYDATVGHSQMRQHQTCRGLTHYRVETSADADCASRILLPTADARLIALDAKTGAECGGFGQNGAVDLSANMPHFYPGSYYSTSPPVVANGLIVIGGAVNDNVSTTEPSGVIRAYNSETGELVWNFDSGNPEQTEPLAQGETYVGNSPNAWSMLSVDEELGIVYAPMGNAPPDQYGGDRTEETERFSSSVTALDLATGEVRWVRQLVHHDLWDMDTPSQPQLVDIRRDGGVMPALVQATKQGDIYVLDRRTGEPLLPVTEEAAPQGAVEGDFTAPTQPRSAMSFAPEPLRESDMWGATMLDQLYCRIRYRELNYEGRYTPPSVNGTIVYPGNFGTFNWGGVAVDPVRQVVIANPVYLAFIVKLIPRADDTTSYVSEQKPGFNENYGAPYAAEMRPFWSPIGLPCQQPPWGYVAAASLDDGDVVWQHRNGTVRDLSPLPLPFEMGVPAIGGPIVTAGGVAFHSGTLDYYVRAFDVTTGAKLWQDRLPAGGQATPMTYEGADGRQYLVVVAGGHGSTGTKPGDYVIAYALPE